MQMATVDFYFDTRRAKKSINSHPIYQDKQTDVYPIKLRVTHQRKQYYYPFPSRYDLTKEDYLKLFNVGVKGELKRFQSTLIAERKEAEDIVKDLGKNFTISIFDRRLRIRSNSNTGVLSLMATISEGLRKNGQIATAIMTNCAIESFKKFDGDRIPFQSITKDWLQAYEQWMIGSDATETTVGMYLRRLRAAYNVAIKEGLISSENYPFGATEYIIPVGRNIKKALSMESLNKIMNYTPRTESEEWARDMWLFSFYANGANIKDIIQFRRRDMDENRISFSRKKTKSSTRSRPVTITIGISRDMQRLIDKWCKNALHPDDYLLPVLEHAATDEKIHFEAYNLVKLINKRMKSICKELGIDQHVTTYSSRHSFATIVRNSGKSVEFVAEALGHSSITTTQNYLASFDIASVKENAKYLDSIRDMVFQTGE